MHSNSARKLVGVCGDPKGERYELLFRALGKLYPVDFRATESANYEALDGLIALNGDLAAGMAAAASGVPAYVAMKDGEAPIRAAGRQVRFATTPLLEACLRGQLMVDRESPDTRPLTVQNRDEVVAHVATQPLWLARRVESSVCHVVGAAPPALAAGECLFQHLKGRRFLGLLPLLHFLRGVARDIDWDAPPPRACFVFDDPNLHWRSYGYLNYRALAEHAALHNYFASVATIPLDAWWVNRGVAATLRASSPRLSILIHGNNHTTYEMLRAHDGADRLAVAAQAMRRMDRLARRHGIPFLKIMEAPYGAVAAEMFPHLLALGYEAALCTPALLWEHNPQIAWPATFGLDRSEILGGGLPVIPRIIMSPDWKNDVLLAAFLRQPIVISGHHYDAAHGMEMLTELAETVNRLEGIAWSDLPEILRTNYRWRRDGETLIVRMYARRVTFPAPPGVRFLRVERTWVDESRGERLTVAASSGAHQTQMAGPLTEEMPLRESAVIEVASEVERPLHFASVQAPFPSPWPYTRKVLMEFRDRMSPMLPAMDRLRRRTLSKH